MTARAPSSSDPPGSADATFEANFRALGPRLAVPAEPDAERIASWQRGAVPPAPRLASSRRPRRVGRWLAAGAAMAASFALGLSFFAGTRQSVSAATILQDLQSRLVRGLDLTMAGVVADGTAADGTIRIRFDQPITLEAMFGSDAPPPSVVAVDMAVQETQPAAFDVRIRAGLSRGDNWLYMLPSAETVEAIARQDAVFGQILGLARQGMLIDLGDADVLGAGRAAAKAAPPALPPAPGDSPFAISIAPVDPAAAATPGVSIDVQTGGAGDGLGGFGGLGAALVRQGGTQLQEIREALAGVDGDATVEQLGDDAYLLTARLAPEAGDPLLSLGGTLRITYDARRGVRRLELADLARGGSITAEFVDAPIDPALLDRAAVVTPQTLLIDANNLRQLLPAAP